MDRLPPNSSLFLFIPLRSLLFPTPLLNIALR